MNYKINNVEKNIGCDTVLFDELQNLRYGKIKVGTRDVVVFNATLYCNSIGVKFDITRFSQSNKAQIDKLSIDGNINCNELFFISKDGICYMSQELAVLFLSVVDVSLYTYFNEMIFDLLYKGIAISDKRIMDLVVDRVPNEALEKIIESRNEGK